MTDIVSFPLLSLPKDMIKCIIECMPRMYPILYIAKSSKHSRAQTLVNCVYEVIRQKRIDRIPISIKELVRYYQDIRKDEISFKHYIQTFKNRVNLMSGYGEFCLEIKFVKQWQAYVDTDSGTSRIVTTSYEKAIDYLIRNITEFSDKIVIYPKDVMKHILQNRKVVLDIEEWIITQNKGLPSGIRDEGKVMNKKRRPRKYIP